MEISKLSSHDEVHQERYAADPEYAAESDRLALAGAVSVAVVRYRADHDLSQAAMVSMLELEQSGIDLLERGDVTPSEQTLQRLVRTGVIEGS